MGTEVRPVLGVEVAPNTGTDNATFSDQTLATLSSSALDPLFWKNACAGLPSPWHVHVPFVSWLVPALAPRVIVELGTGHCVSYVTFCEAAVNAGLATHCYAVGTLEKASAGSSRNHDDLLDIHDDRYARLSTFLRITFDEALSHFADGSIDLLCIDCGHDKAVSDAFKEWRRKLSSRAVVLIHGIAARESDIWHFWQGVRVENRSFEFLHGDGLGLLLIGDEVPVAGMELCANKDFKLADLLRERFEALGQRYALQAYSTYLAQARGDAAPTLAAATRVRAALVAQLESPFGQQRELRAELETALQAVEAQEAALRELRTDRILLSEGLRDRRAEQKSLRARLATTLSALNDADLAKAAILNDADLVKAGLEIRIAEAETALRSMTASKSWRMTAPARMILTWLLRQTFRTRLIMAPSTLSAGAAAARRTIAASLRRKIATSLPRIAARFDPPPEPQTASNKAESEYHRWIRTFDELNPEDRTDIGRQCAASDFPSVLVIFIFDPVSAGHAEATIERLSLQLFDRWEAWLCFDLRCDSGDVAAARDAARDKPNIKVMQAPIGDLSAPKFADCVLFSFGGVLLREHALSTFASAARVKETCLIYSDQDRIDAAGERTDPFFKPDYSPELLRRTEYIGPCVLVRAPDLNPRAMIEDVLAGLQSIVLWAEDIARQVGSEGIVHVPFVLYHDALESRAIHSSVPNLNVLDESLPRVSIIIPTRDRLDLLKPCLDSIAELTDYPANKFEIVVVDNNSTDPTTLRFLDRQSEVGAIRVLLDQRKFNYSRLNNCAALHTKSEILLFLNNDTLVNDSKWLKQIVLHAIQKDVGAVGSKLLYPDRKVQHGGLILGLHGLAAHAHVGLAENAGGYHNLANETHEISAVTGACLAIRREVFEEIGGFDTSLEVAFSDVLLCAKLIEHGYRNIYVGNPLLFHLESKSRGCDDTPEKKIFFQREARYARSQCRSLFHNDPYYNPNLSFDRPYGLAFPPRRRKPWRRLKGKLRVLMLSWTCEIGHSVAVVLNLQAEYLAQLGHDVFIGGPRGGNEFAFEGCRRIHLDNPTEAAVFAVVNDVDCIVAHTPPFFSVVRSIGEWPKSILYDYGEPDPSFFDDAEARRGQLAEKHLVFEMAHRVYAISRSVKLESGADRMEVIPLGNSHLAVWNDDFVARREAIRQQRGWTDKVVVLNVCRFNEAERAYIGVDRYALILDDLIWTRPTLASNVIFVLCGKATQQDVIDMEAEGLVVCANVSDSELIDLYSAADIYMNFSRWEGYNLGIGQALAFGLPVIASDILAHREFGVSTADDSESVFELLAPLVKRSIASGHKPDRKPILWTWDDPLKQFATAVEAVCLEQ